eukprot:CAMPEP_0170139930 /NCGR_PEP_ID=MMETSP0033_2-20121228/6001_1 /TAXON_ID=195969 /ORGANISM="Dolichomastix tenuilepis, Strain CCMP3274" /LENGTH=222 /DNA_ID=CAMNT_0010376089 /DNA_START=56 /DNA_END=724 /DNA_ORIENTATION=-
MDMAAMQQAMMEQQLLQVAQTIEDSVDEQLHKLENLGEEDLENIRRKRLEAMKHQAGKRQQWIQMGHGCVEDLLDEKEFFKAMKGEDRMVVHFFRNNWPCKVMDKHIEVLARNHLETKFARIDAEKSPYLVEKLKIWMLPTLALVKSEKTVDYVVGLDELGGTDDFSTETLRLRLAHAGVLNYQEGGEELVHREQKSAGPVTTSTNVRKGGRDSDDEDSDFD